MVVSPVACGLADAKALLDAGSRLNRKLFLPKGLLRMLESPVSCKPIPNVSAMQWKHCESASVKLQAH